MSANDQDGGSVTAAHDGVPAISVPGGEPVPVVRALQEVDAALAGLIELPVGAQVAVFTDLHQRLTAALAVTATAGAADESARPRFDNAHDDRRAGQQAGNLPEPGRQQPETPQQQRPGQPQQGPGPQQRPGAAPHRPGPPPHRGR